MQHVSHSVSPRFWWRRGRALAAAALLVAGGAAACTGEIGARDSLPAEGSAGIAGVPNVSGSSGAGGAGGAGSDGAATGGSSAGAGPDSAGGVVEPPTAMDLPPGTQWDPTSGKVVPVDANAAGPRPLVRLTRREYNNTVRDLLGDTTHPADQFADDASGDFLFRRVAVVAPHDADLLQSTAQALATAALKNVNAVVGCTTADEACARHFLLTFGQKAYRRPFTGAETDRYIALYTKARSTFGLGFSDSIGLLVQAMLQSPAFLYHWERAPDDALLMEGTVARLSSYEVASRLSYFLWGSMPDDLLLQAAASGELETPAQLQVQAMRMLADAKARDGAADFFAQLLEVASLPDRPKSPTVYPSFTPALAADMALETAAFVKDVIFDGDGRLETLLDANYSFVNASLGSLYGEPVQGSTLQKLLLDDGQRRGILTQAAFLTANAASDGSHPPRRGKAVYEKLLCGELPPPPMGVPPVAPASAGGTTRARYSVHDTQDCAKGCHSIMDPIGFAFEHYDGIGQFRTTDNGGAVDSSSVVHLDGVDVQVSDAIALTRALATSDTVRACMATQWLRYALGRPMIDADGAAVVHAREGFVQNDYRFTDLIAAIASSRSFQYRSPADGEATQ